MPGLRDRKTPGVYVTEFTAFPPSAVGIDTAIPAFIGYTQRADIQGRPVVGVPIRIRSLAEYHDVFGGAPDTTFEFIDGTADEFDLRYTYDDAPTTFRSLKPSGKVGLLYHSMNLFYANGGATCFVVSVGPYPETVDSEKLKLGVRALEDQVGPTMLVVPDLTLLPFNPEKPEAVPGFRDVAVEMLNQCGAKQDRIALLDVVHTRAIGRNPPVDALDKAIDQFRADVEHEFRDYGVAYFPYLNTSIVRPTDLNFTKFDLAGRTEFILYQALQLFPDKQNPAVLLVKEDFKNGDFLRPEKKEDVRAHVAEALKVLAATNPLAAKKLGIVEKLDPFRPAIAETVPPTVEVVSVTPDTGTADPATTAVSASPKPGTPEAIKLIKTIDQNLTNAFPSVEQLYALAAKKINRLPASAAMAGVMTFTDHTRGVWNAPANIGLTSVDEPALRINDDRQGDLNKPIDGKAINVVREFIGRGPVVWGARTLDGNSPDYRYVQVRRTLIYIEQSVKSALNQFVFAANDGKTWVTVISMVSNFLQDLWSQGGLMGATPKEAFSVDCGLGTTMTGRDVLEGYMIVQVSLQMIHPAEFIELTFKQRMENVG